MRLIKGCIIAIVALALTAGCAPKRLLEGKGERIPLSQVLTQTLQRYEGVDTLQTPVSIKLEVREEFYILRGLFLYESPASLRLRLAASLGPTVGELIYTDGLLTLLMPSKGKLYQGWIGEEGHRNLETLFLVIRYDDYAELEGRRFPTRIYGEGEGFEIRFDVKLKDPQVDIALPEGAFTPPTAGWEVHPLEDLKDFMQGSEAGKRP